MIKQIIITFIYCISVFSLLLAQKTTSKLDPELQAMQKHYEYLTSEAKANRELMASENKEFRMFIQTERTEHRKFLELSYSFAGIVTLVVGALLTFFGWNTLQGIQKSKKDLETLIKEYEQKIEIAEENLKEAENKYNNFVNYYSSANPETGNFVLIGSAQKINDMKQNELNRFVQKFRIPKFVELGSEDWQNFDPTSFDLVIYRSNVNEHGEDSDLERLIDLMKKFANKPIVVYADGQKEYIKNKTDKKLRDNCLFHMATNPVTLIDNTVSAFRVARMLPKTTITT